MRASEGIKLQIKEFEGLRLTAYSDNGLGWSIGYGHFGVNQGDTITKAQAEALFEEDVLEAERLVRKWVNNADSRLLQSQFDALVSFFYNLGGNYKSSYTLHKLINEDPDQAAIYNKFLEYRMSGGQVLGALERRRKEEADWYFMDVGSVPVIVDGGNEIEIPSSQIPDYVPPPFDLGAIDISASSSLLSRTKPENVALAAVLTLILLLAMIYYFNENGSLKWKMA